MGVRVSDMTSDELVLELEAKVEQLSKSLSWALDDRDAARAEVERLQAVIAALGADPDTGKFVPVEEEVGGNSDPFGKNVVE
jgi:hypothetical protein